MSLRSPRNSPLTSSGAHSGWQLGFVVLLWSVIYLLSASTPTLLDDADATHAQAAQAMLRTGDWVTLHVNGIRYLEKPPLPYWITACSLQIFGNNSFAVHLPLALTVGGLAALAWVWGRQAFGERAGFYAAAMLLTATGTFLFTRIFIPDALLSLFLALTLYAALRALAEGPANTRAWAAAGWSALAAAVLTKGLVALVLALGAIGLYLWISGERRRWHQLHPVLGTCLLLALAGPWHVLAGLRNRGGAGGHGFFWFYFVNEHLLRFLGRRSPPDYNKLPSALFWSLHLVWLFPWSLLLPAAAILAWHKRHLLAVRQLNNQASFAGRSATLLLIFAALVLVFFSLSTNQEYYTFPVYLPVLLLVGATISRVELKADPGPLGSLQRRTLIGGHIGLVCVGTLAAGALGYGLWTSRQLAAATDIGVLLAHRGVGNYTLSMSHFFDLTGPSFSALRSSAVIACCALGAGPLLALGLRRRALHAAATITIMGMAAMFFVAAHLALNRFAPLLSSGEFARAIAKLETDGEAAPNSEVLLFGDQALGSSIPFYLEHRVLLVDGRSTSMLFGSTFPDAPPVFITHGELLASWGTGPRKLLFVPMEHRAEVDALLGPRQIPVYEKGGKALVTDRPLGAISAPPSQHATPQPAAGWDHRS